MAAQTYFPVAAYGGGVVVAPCDVVFLNEVARCNALGLLPGLVNAGQIGDPRHKTQGTDSDYNPFVQGPSGLWYIRAHDFSGPKATRWLLNEFWNDCYRRRDPRVYPFGYTNSADPPPHGLTIWYSAGLTRQGSDGDHEHESLSRANTTTVGRSAWTPALDSLAPWGLEAWIRNRTGNPTQEDDMTPDEHNMLVETDARAKNIEAVAGRTLEFIADHDQALTDINNRMRNVEGVADRLNRYLDAQGAAK